MQHILRIKFVQTFEKDHMTLSVSSDSAPWLITIWMVVVGHKNICRGIRRILRTMDDDGWCWRVGWLEEEEEDTKDDDGWCWRVGWRRRIQWRPADVFNCFLKSHQRSGPLNDNIDCPDSDEDENPTQIRSMERECSVIGREYQLCVYWESHLGTRSVLWIWLQKGFWDIQVL